MGLLNFDEVKIYSNNKTLIEGFNYSIEEGEIYPLVFGAEDSELASFFRFVLGLRGYIEGNISTNKKEKWKDIVGFLPREGGYYPFLNGLEQLQIIEKLYPDFSLQKAREIIYKFKIPLEVNINKLPDFQRKLILICGLFATGVDILFLEEPLAHLPGEEVALLQYLMREEVEDDRTIVLTITKKRKEQYEFENTYQLKQSGIEKIKKSKEQKQNKITKTVRKIPVWDQEKAFLVDHKDIKWISTYQGQSTLHTIKGDFTVKMLLRELEARLNTPPFFRCHRSYIINLNYIEEVITWFNGTYNLKVGDEEIPVSRSRAEQLEKLLGF